MKELGIEEKARRYDEAIKKLRSLHDDYDAVSTLIDIKEELEHIFPELKESEDEKTRKEIMYHIQHCDDTIDKETEERMIAWLEKQGEQNVANSAKTCKVAKFKVGDWIAPKKPEIIHEDYRICQIIKIEDGDYIIESIYSYQGRNSFDFIENTNRLWTIQDARDGDVLVSNQIIILFKNFEEDSDCNFVIAYAGIDISGKLQITNGHWLISNDAKPAAKEQRELLFQKIKEAGYKWSVKKKELKKKNIE